MLGKLKERLQDDSGSSSLVSGLLVTILFLGLVITAFDVNFYLANRSQVASVAREAARTVATYGGAGTATMSTSIEKSYGVSRAAACSTARFNDTPNRNFAKAITADYNAIECNTLYAIAKNHGLMSVTFDGPGDGVDCGPKTPTPNIGTRTYCTVKYSYNSLPGAPLGFVNMRHDEGVRSGLLSQNVITQSSESEVANPLYVSR